MTTFIVPTDFSDTAKNALHYACHMAASTGGSITLLHVYDIPIADSNMALDLMTSYKEELNRQILDKLKILADEISIENDGVFNGIEINLKASHGFTVEEILSAANDSDASLIVMGTTGAGGIKEFFVGSNTEKIIQSATCPVLAIPENAKYNGVETIVYASDLVEGDKPAIKELTHVAETFDARIVIVHFIKDEEKEKLGQYRQSMKAMIDVAANYDKIDIDYVVYDNGDMETRLTEYLERANADMLAMLAKKQNFLQGLFHESLTRKMAYHSHIPLLAFHQ